jgi:hypothetical protein
MQVRRETAHLKDTVKPRIPEPYWMFIQSAGGRGNGTREGRDAGRFVAAGWDNYSPRLWPTALVVFGAHIDPWTTSAAATLAIRSYALKDIREERLQRGAPDGNICLHAPTSSINKTNGTRTSVIFRTRSTAFSANR